MSSMYHAANDKIKDGSSRHMKSEETVTLLLGSFDIILRLALIARDFVAPQNGCKQTLRKSKMSYLARCNTD